MDDQYPEGLHAIAQEYLNKYRPGHNIGHSPKRGYMVRPAYIILRYDTNVPVLVDWRGSENDAERVARELYEQDQKAGLLGASEEGLPGKESANSRNGSKDMARKKV